MAIRDWTVGQLLVLWGALLVLSFIAAIVLGIAMDATGWGDILLVWAFAFAVASLPALGATWHWMGRRSG